MMTEAENDMEFKQITADDVPELHLALDLLRGIDDAASRDRFLQSVMPQVLRMFGGSCGGVVSQHDGSWVIEYWLGERMRVPESLVSEALDRNSTQFDAGWLAAPLAAGDSSSSHERDSNQRPTAVVIRVERMDRDATRELQKDSGRLQRSVGLLASALQRIEESERDTRRIEQLSSVLQAAAQWQMLDDDKALLERIAATAIKLLHCERASIFLWDRRRGKLIGRPAVGVADGHLEVDDNVGIVGEVLRSGETRLWNSGSDDSTRVNRRVDQSLSFETRSLVAVPLRGRRDELIGVFEAINRVSGDGIAGDRRNDGFDEMDARLLTDLATHAAVAIESQRTRRSLTEANDRLIHDAAASTPLVGNDPSISSLRLNAQKVAGTDLTVLVLGANGTGKEVLARQIHYESKRRSGPFIAVNCAALVESLLESELFGHEKGAFTDAQQTRVGKFELATGGTLFLDEIGDMSPGGQAKLLRVLEEKVVVRVGGSMPIPVDVRVIAATNQPLEQLISQKRFREDLFFRLSVVSLTLPPLRARGNDVLVLADHFLTQFSYEIGRTKPTLDGDAKQTLLTHPWPGNIRELRNTMERVCYLCSDDIIRPEDLMLIGPISVRQETTSSIGDVASFDPTLSESTRQFQVGHIDRAIAVCRGNMTDAAARLGLHRSNLYRKMRQLGMPTSGDSGEASSDSADDMDDSSLMDGSV